nr:hypothetical protein [Evansella caseinilytica]
MQYWQRKGQGAKPLHLFKSPIGVVFSYRACSDEQSYCAFPIELSRRIVIEAVLAEEETSTAPLP